MEQTNQKEKTQKKKNDVKTIKKHETMRGTKKSSSAEPDDLKTKSLASFKDEKYGTIGTEKRNKLEEELDELKIMMLLKLMRKKEKVTLELIASRMDVDKSVISRLENKSEDRKLSTIVRYVKALDAKMYIRFETSSESEEIELV